MGCSDCQNKVLATVRGKEYVDISRAENLPPHLSSTLAAASARPRGHFDLAEPSFPSGGVAASATYLRACPRVHRSTKSTQQTIHSRRTEVFMAVRAMRMQQLHRSPSVGPGRKRASASAHERGRSTGAARAHKLALCQLVPRLTLRRAALSFLLLLLSLLPVPPARGSLAVDRRAALAAGALVLGGGALPRAARAEQQRFVEESMGFALTLPDGWEAGVGEIRCVCEGATLCGMGAGRTRETGLAQGCALAQAEAHIPSATLAGFARLRLCLTRCPGAVAQRR